MNDSATRLNLTQQAAVHRAGELIAISAGDIAVLSEYVGAADLPDTWRIAYFYARHTIEGLLDVIDELTGGTTR